MVWAAAAYQSPTAAAQGQETRAGPGGRLGGCPRVVLAAELPQSLARPGMQSQRSALDGSKGFCLEPALCRGG